MYYVLLTQPVELNMYTERVVPSPFEEMGSGFFWAMQCASCTNFLPQSGAYE